jgi:putative Ig domain-containing protein
MNAKRLARGSRLARFASFAAIEILLFSGVLLALSRPAQQGSSKLTITTKSLPNATAGVEYYAVIAATGGEPPYDCSGAGLPPNLAFHYTSDTIGGKATTPGTYSVVITVTDSAEPPHSVSATFKLTVLAAK